MIFYLENDAKFHLYFNNLEVIYLENWDAFRATVLKTIRWIPKGAFKNKHLEEIVD